MNCGDRVFHRVLGWGTVKRIIQKASKEELWVDFGYVKEYLPTEELQTTDEQERDLSRPESSSEAIQNKQIFSETRLISAVNDVAGQSGSRPHFEVGSWTDARKGVVALRLGQILDSQIFQLSVGTGELEAKLRSSVEIAKGQRPSFLLVEGVWGGGKTHALTLLQAIASAAGFTASSVVMDGVSLSLSEPMHLMEEILSSLRFPKHIPVQHLADLLRVLVKGGKLSLLKTKGVTGIPDLLERVPALALDDAEALGHIQDYLSLSLSATQANQRLRQLGYDASRLPMIRVLRVEERNQAFCVLMQNWAHMVSAVGSRGLLVVLDELDVDYASTAYADKAAATRRERRRAFLLKLRMLTKWKAPLLMAFASAPAGPDISPDHDAVEDVLNVFGDDISHVKVPVPSKENLIELFDKLKGIYSLAYPSSRSAPTSDDVNALLENLLSLTLHEANYVPRHFVRAAIEAFDLLSVSEKPFSEVIGLITLKK